MANYTNRGSHYKAASREEKRRPWRKKGLAVLACLLAVAFAAGVAALAVPGLFRTEDEVTLEKTIYWWDNDNEGNPRPQMSEYKPVLVLRDEANKVEYKSDDPDALALLKSLDYPDGWPDVVVAPDQGNTWKVTTSPESLNKIVYQVDEETGELVEGDDGNPVPTGNKVTWSLSQGFPPEVEGYTAIYAELAESLGGLFGSFSTVGEDDWHYVRNADYTFTIDLRSGSLENLSGITQKILEQFELEASFTTKDGEQQTPHASLAELKAKPGYATVQFQVRDGEGEWQTINLDNPEAMKEVHDELRLSLTMPKYTIEGQPITYKVAEANTEGNKADGKLDYKIPGFEGTDDADDYFAIKYDNTNATNHGSATDGAYSGGSVILTLTGTTKYEATKVWQDKDGKKEDRPADVTLELWRYVAGQPLESAAAVRDSQGNIYTYDVSEETASGEEMTVTFHDKDAEGQPLEDPADFPKYDPEGNRYIYVVKEYGLSGNYTQVFGEVNEETGVAENDFIKGLNEDGVVVDKKDGRESGNTYLYNGGTLNNVLNGTTTATATKVWNASAFQAEFGGVKVELTLQSRAAGTENWENVLSEDGVTPITHLLDGFQAENLAGLSYSEDFPQYDNLGRELEYRWVETGVTQVLTDADGNVTETVETNFDPDKGTFTLQQTDSTGKEREVKYTSVSEGPDEEGNTKITNSVANEVHYEVDKWWALKEDEVTDLELDENDYDPEKYLYENGQWYTKDIGTDDSAIKDDNAKSATFYLYRVESGEQVPMDEPGGYYLSFTMSKNGGVLGEGTASEADRANIKLEYSEDSPWHVNITGLPEFDEGGRQYDYVLVEADASPRYETERESDGYYTEVYNPRGPGEVLQILVQKNWIDDSDTVHREPVVIQAYKKSTGEKIEDASVTLENGLWYDWITIQLGSSVGDGNNPETGESTEPTNTDTNGNGGTSGVITEPGEGNEPTEGDETGDEPTNTDEPGETDGEGDNNTDTDSVNTPEESEVSESLLSNEGQELAAPKTGDGEGENQDPLNENEGSTGDGGTPSGGTEDAKPDGVQSIKDIYLLEYSIGEVPVTNTIDGSEISDGIIEETDTSKWYDQVTGDVTSQYHRYQVTYSDFTPIDGTPAEAKPGESGKYSATVTNRRLGNIDITVHKVWNSGDGDEADDLRQKLQQAQIPGATEQGASLALRLSFHESMGEDHGYTIEGGYVTLGNGAEKTTIYNVKREVGTVENPVPSDGSFGQYPDPGSSVIPIKFPDEEGAGKEKDYYFSNLPKYDTTGTIVRYTVEEGLKSEDGKFISFEEYIAQAGDGDELAAQLKKWVHTMEEGDYVTALDPTGALPQVSTKDVDFQTFEATNSLTGTKNVQWHKEWNDAYRNEAGERPDIFLDVFRLVHTSDDTTKLELVVKDYQWTPTEDKDPVNNWTATMEGVPLYDSLGYKITYFAVERAVNDTERFDYGPVRYWVNIPLSGLQCIGDRLEVENDQYLKPTPDGVQYACSLKDGDDYVEVVGMGEETLKERYRDREVNYALGEGGTFENYLRANPNLAGSKLWQGVESGYPTDQLPQVTFALYQTIVGEEADPENPGGETDPEEVATLQVNWGGDFGMLNGSLTTDFRFFMLGNWQVDWDQTNNRYIYTSDESNDTYYVNSDWQVVGEDGEEIDLPDTVRLPQYDEEGNRYAYTMVEQSITMMGPDGENKITIKLDPDGTPSEDNEEKAVAFYESIFTDAKVTEGTFQATNVYNDKQEGQLAVEKWLNVGETKPESYPAIRVKLYRAVTSQKDNEDAWRLVDSHIWKSNEVQEKFTGDTPDAWGYLEYTFENLPIYAPNGEKYVYKVVEVKENFLDGYDTWAVKGPVEQGDLDGKMEDDNRKEVVSDLEATEVLEDSEPTPDLDTATFINKREADSVKLQGTKVWDDWNNELGLRPDNADDLPITLVVSRRADAQEGQGNAIDWQELAEGTDYTVIWDTNPTDKKDTWTYTITGVDNTELERYAPNGMPWIYQVTETISDPYDYYNASTRTVTFGTEPDDKGFLTVNSAAAITNSLKTSVTFQKQWQGEDKEPISTDYFGKVTVEFKLQVAFAPDTGKEADWQDAETFFTNDDPASEGQVSVPSNVLPMTGDDKYEFESSKTAKMNEASEWTATFSNLPRAVKVGKEVKKLTYRVVETSVTYTLPGEESTTVTVTPPDGTGQNYVLNDTNGIFTGAELESNGATWITTNTMKTVDLKITKIWDDQNNKYGTRPEGGNGEWVVDFLVQYSTEEQPGGDGWYTLTSGAGDAAQPVVIQLNSSSPTTTANGETAYTVTVKDLPGGRRYRAVELKPGYTTGNVDEYICDENGGTFHIGYTVSYGDENPVQGGDGQADFITTATNTLDTTSVSVKKNWEPEKLPDDDQYPSVTMKVQYKAGEDDWKDLEDCTVILSEGNWEHTFADLPKYYPGADGYAEKRETQYRVVELDGEGYVLVEGPEEGTDNEGYKTFTFTNKPVVDFTVEKQWNSVPEAAYNWKVTVGLYRTTEEDFDPTAAEEADFAEKFAVSDPDDSKKQYVLTLDSSNNYTDTFEDLDKYCMEEAGTPEYTYYVKELTVDGDKIDGTGFTKVVDGEDVKFTVDYTYAETGDAATVVNRVEGSLQVKKVWHDKGGEGVRPAEITVGLYRFDKASQDYVAVKDPSNLEENYTLTLDEENGWQGTFENLPEYYSDGSKVQYAVYELDSEDNPIKGTEDNNTLPATDGGSYTVYYDGFTIHNVREVDLTIEKTVTGDAADPGRQFTFEVGFTYDEDMPAGSIGPYTYTVYQKGEGDAADVPVKENIEIPSAGGTISLTGGQYAVIEGLPAGTAYTVTEKEANEDGYVTTPTDGKVEGTITAGEENKVSFTNCRAPGHLVIQKQVTGSRGDQNKQWEFHLKADLLEGMPYWGSSVGYRSDGSQVDLVFHAEDGYATFTLKSGESLEIKDFPIGTKFTVTEVEANQGYTTTVKGNGTAVPDGMEVKLEYDVTSTVTFINHKPGGGGPGPGPTPTPTPEPEETPTPEPGETPTPAPEGSPSPEPSGTPGPDGTPTPAPSGSPSPSGSPTPGPGGSPTPAPTPTPPGGDTPDDTPQTGDPTHTLWWALAGAGALSGLGALWATRPKGHKARHRKK